MAGNGSDPTSGTTVAVLLRMDQRARSLAASHEAPLGDWVELEWPELVARLARLLDSEEKELLPRLDRDAARGIVQEIRYLRGRAVELGNTGHSAATIRAFLAEIRAHVQRSEHLGSRFPDA
jgi:hypothetical protein